MPAPIQGPIEAPTEAPIKAPIEAPIQAHGPHENGRLSPLLRTSVAKATDAHTHGKITLAQKPSPALAAPTPLAVAARSPEIQRATASEAVTAPSVSPSDAPSVSPSDAPSAALSAALSISPPGSPPSIRSDKRRFAPRPQVFQVTSSAAEPTPIARRAPVHKADASLLRERPRISSTVSASPVHKADASPSQQRPPTSNSVPPSGDTQSPKPVAATASPAAPKFGIGSSRTRTKAMATSASPFQDLMPKSGTKVPKIQRFATEPAGDETPAMPVAQPFAPSIGKKSAAFDAQPVEPGPKPPRAAYPQSRKSSTLSRASLDVPVADQTTVTAASGNSNPPLIHKRSAPPSDQPRPIARQVPWQPSPSARAHPGDADRLLSAPTAPAPVTSVVPPSVVPPPLVPPSVVSPPFVPSSVVSPRVLPPSVASSAVARASAAQQSPATNNATWSKEFAGPSSDAIPSVTARPSMPLAIGTATAHASPSPRTISPGDVALARSPAAPAATANIGDPAATAPAATGTTHLAAPAPAAPAAAAAPIDIAKVAQQVRRILQRELAVERERRGVGTWR